MPNGRLGRTRLVTRDFNADGLPMCYMPEWGMCYTTADSMLVGMCYQMG